MIVYILEILHLATVEENMVVNPPALQYALDLQLFLSFPLPGVKEVDRTMLINEDFVFF